MEADGSWHIHKSVPLVPIQSWINPVHTIPSYFFKSEYNFFSHLHQFLLSGFIRLASNVPFTQKFRIVNILGFYHCVYKSTL